MSLCVLLLLKKTFSCDVMELVCHKVQPIYFRVKQTVSYHMKKTVSLFQGWRQSTRSVDGRSPRHVLPRALPLERPPSSVCWAPANLDMRHLLKASGPQQRQKIRSTLLPASLRAGDARPARRPVQTRPTGPGSRWRSRRTRCAYLMASAIFVLSLFRSSVRRRMK